MLDAPLAPLDAPDPLPPPLDPLDELPLELVEGAPTPAPEPVVAPELEELASPPAPALPPF